MNETARADDAARVAAKIEAGWETIRYRTLWICEKFSADQLEHAKRKLGLPTLDDISSATLRTLGLAPELVEEVAGNMLMNEGIGALLLLLTGGSATAYSNANARIGVGDSTTAEAATQTDLQAATNKLYKAMNATFPTIAAQTVTFQSDFTNAEANYAWQEWTVDNGASAAKNLNRKVQSLGTKASGTWTLTAQITFS